MRHDDMLLDSIGEAIAYLVTVQGHCDTTAEAYTTPKSEKIEEQDIIILVSRGAQSTYAALLKITKRSRSRKWRMLCYVTDTD